MAKEKKETTISYEFEKNLYGNYKVVCGADEAGVLYGLITLADLLHKEGSEIFLAKCEIFEINIAIFSRADQFPNISENGNWYVELPAIATVRTIRANVINNGEIDVYPIIHIYNTANQVALMSGFSGVIITNETTGAKIELDYSPSDGEEIIIDLALRRITSNLAGNIINYISDDTVLSDFILKTGENIISCENLSGLTSLSAIVEYTNNYAMAVVK